MYFDIPPLRVVGAFLEQVLSVEIWLLEYVILPFLINYNFYNYNFC